MANGTRIATIAFLAGDRWLPRASLYYYRSHHARLLLASMPPMRKWGVGRFEASVKVPDAPYLDGAVFYKKEKVGYLITYESDDGNKVTYQLNMRREVPNGASLTVKLED